MLPAVSSIRGPARRPQHGARAARLVAAAAGLLVACERGECEDDERPFSASAWPLPCDPMHTHEGGERMLCCSDDPAAASGALPDYPLVATDEATAPALFSDARNRWSNFGQCEADARSGSPWDLRGQRCTRPCNPRWTADEVGAVCGAGHQCLQTVPTDPSDCIFVDGRWRGVRGTDMSEPQDWAQLHAKTRQDPDLIGCTAWAQREDGSRDDDRFADCVAQLGTAELRGLCVGMLGEAQHVPAADDPTLDVCGARNR